MHRKHYRKPWTKERTEYLIGNHSDKPNDLIAEELSLTRTQVAAKAVQLGLKKTPACKSKIVSLTNWNRQPCLYTDDEVLRLFERTRSYKEVSRITGLTVSSLACRNSRDWKIKLSLWSDEKTKQLAELFPVRTDKALEELLGLSAKKIQAKARALGLFKTEGHRAIVQEANGKLIASGPKRHQWLPGSLHPGYKQDRSQVINPRPSYLCFTRRTKDSVRVTQEGRCRTCGTMIEGSGEFDHIVPLVSFGTGELSNCQLLCHSCHSKKTRSEYPLWSLKTKHYQFLARDII